MIGALLAVFALYAVQATAPISEGRPEPVINTGAGLLENCTYEAKASGPADLEFHTGLCIGFIKGVTNTLSEQRLGDFCPPEATTNEDLKVVVVDWLRKHPKVLGEPAVGAVVSAMTEAFSCPSATRLE